MCRSFSVVNAFAGESLAGSPTPVCFSAEPLLPADMLAIAKELKHPVTAFVWPQANAAYAIRYFTHLTEIGACGHATLAAAAFMAFRTGTAEINFQTKDGNQIPASVKDGRVTMTYAALPLRSYPAGEALLRALNLTRFDSVQYAAPLETVFFRLKTVADVERLPPDFQQLSAVSGAVKEVVVAAACGNGKFDYVLRSFCPWIGINEDPVTGSVHAALAPYWAQALGKTKLRARQASKAGGDVHLTVTGHRVEIRGICVVAEANEPALW